MKPVEIKYRDGKNKVVTIKADACSGEIPAHSNTFYCVFYRLKDGSLARVIARVAKSRLLPGYYKVYQKLYGRPWLDKVRKAEQITLRDYFNWEATLGGLPDDVQTVWSVNYDDNTWVIVAGNEPTRATLHIMNNPDITKRGGNASEAIKKLFPGKKVCLVQHGIVAAAEVEL